MCRPSPSCTSLVTKPRPTRLLIMVTIIHQSSDPMLRVRRLRTKTRTMEDIRADKTRIQAAAMYLWPWSSSPLGGRV